jgi:hypothetical protein
MAKRSASKCPPHFFNVPTPSKDVEPVARCRRCGHKRKVLNSIPFSYWRNAKGERPNQKKKVKT